MTKYIFILFLIAVGIVHTAQAQTGTIKGNVSDSKTLTPLPFATVYINHTTFGVEANEKGEFELANIPFGTHELIASFVGHEAYQSKIIVSDSLPVIVTIRLSPITMKAVEVSAKKDNKWKKQFEKFERLFLGTNARLCKILNPWTLDFSKSTNKLFTAEASEVIKIENLALGYRVFYELKTFQVVASRYLITGNVRYEPIVSTDSSLVQMWRKNREKAYLGSVRHFMKSLRDRSAEKDGFLVFEDQSYMTEVIRSANFYDNLGRNIFYYNTVDKIFPDSATNTFYVKLPHRLEIHYMAESVPSKIYRDIPHPVSWIELKDQFLQIDQQGAILNPGNMVVSGEMSEPRIALLLPYDYTPPVQVEFNMKEVKKKSGNPFMSLLEKPYLHTDKSYYYPNEVVWFKAYMNYFAPIMKDSLSHVLYVDIINNSGQLIQKKIFHIKNGSVAGDFTLPSTIPKGDYTLLAYTRWILNFNERLIFSKPFKILSNNEAVKTSKDYVATNVVDEITITTEKEQYDNREKVTLTIETKNHLDKYVRSNLSISVTDMEQAVPLADEKIILTDFPIPEISLLDTLNPNNAYQIQQGIDIKGRFVTMKGKSSQGLLTIAQKYAKGVFAGISDEQGRFHMRDLQLYDTMLLAVDSKTIKGKPGKVILDSIKLPSPVVNVTPLSIEIFTVSERSRQTTGHLSGKMLQAVTVKAKRIKEKPTQTIGIPDITITGDRIKTLDNYDLMYLLQTRVPGLNVSGGYLRIGGPTSFLTDKPSQQEPLVMIDGVAINGDDGETMLRINSTSPRDVERIDVVKYGGGAAYGARGANGVILIYTKKESDNGTSSDYEFDSMQPIKVHGYTVGNKFYSPSYPDSSDMADELDYRSTIFWDPSVTTNGKEPAVRSFYTADLPTQYRIVVEGVTAEGKPVRSEKIISVGKPDDN